MKIDGRFFTITLTVVMILTNGVLAGCSSEQISTDPHIDAIIKIQKYLELPAVPVEFIKMTTMINSPSGDLEVAEYKDTDGRLYYVNPETNQVVEIDARFLLISILPDAPQLSTDELKAKADDIFEATIYDFGARRSSWDYQEGEKIGNHFFVWWDSMPLNGMERPRAQVGIHKSGILFAYINTLNLEQH